MDISEVELGLKKEKKEKDPADNPRLKREDIIFHALEARKAAGAINATIPRDPEAPKEIVFKLK